MPFAAPPNHPLYGQPTNHYYTLIGNPNTSQATTTTTSKPHQNHTPNPPPLIIPPPWPKPQPSPRLPHPTARRRDLCPGGRARVHAPRARGVELTEGHVPGTVRKDEAQLRHQQGVPRVAGSNRRGGRELLVCFLGGEVMIG